MITITVDTDTADRLLVALGVATGAAVRDDDKPLEVMMLRLINIIGPQISDRFQPYKVD